MMKQLSVLLILMVSTTCTTKVEDAFKLADKIGLATDDDINKLNSNLVALHSKVDQVISINDPKPWLDYNRWKYFLLLPLGIAILYFVWRVYSREKQNGLVC